MQHRAILRSAKTGTITYAQALRATRAAKEAKLAGTQPKVPRVADIYGFGFAPAMGDPKSTTPVRVQKRAVKKRPAKKRPAKKRASGRATRTS